MTNAQPNAQIDVRLIAIRYAARDTHFYEFSRPDGAALPTAEAGAHIDIRLPNGIVRQYSLTTAEPQPRAYFVGVKRDPNSRGGSAFMHEKLRVGEILKISHPRNHFPLQEDAPFTVLIAGGIGITPIYCMAERLQSLGKLWKLYYSSRSRGDAPFIEELARANGVTFNFDDESPGKLLDLVAIVSGAPSGAHFYCCGPLPMLHAFEAATKALPREQVHVEYFSADSAPATEGGFVVELARSGREYVVPPGKTILEVLRDGGVDVMSSCEAGVCGACETRVISGEPDHRDVILDESERAASKVMMICCSGSKNERLVLDL